MPPFFSVIIPAYNRAVLIRDALASVFEQTFTDYEVIVVDDGSTDDTVAIVKAVSASTDRPLRVLEQSNAGPGAARNTGIKNATGEYVALLDSDDLWFPWTLKNFHQAIIDLDYPALLGGAPVEVMPGEAINADGNQPLTLESHADFYSTPGNPFFRFTVPGTAIRRASLNKVDGFAGERMNYEDLDLWMRLGTERGFVLITSPPQNVVRRAVAEHISESREHNLRGASFMISSEKTGRYPGGKERQADRRRLLTVLLRGASVLMARSGDYRSAWSLYFQLFVWSLMELRLRYLLGFPLQIVSSMIGRK